MTAKMKGEVPFDAGGQSYTLVFSIDALMYLEETFGCDVKELGDMLGNSLSLAKMRKIFHAGLMEHHPEVQEKDAGRIMSYPGVAKAGELIAQAFLGAFADEGAAKDGEARPRKGKAAGTGAPASTSGSNSNSETIAPSDA